MLVGNFYPFLNASFLDDMNSVIMENVDEIDLVQV